MSASLWRMKTHEYHAPFWRKSPCMAAPETISGVHQNHSVKRSGRGSALKGAESYIYGRMSARLEL